MRRGGTVVMMVKEAAARHLKVEERYQREKAEDMARWERYVETGRAVPHETVTAWLDELAAEADSHQTRDPPTPPPPV